MLETYSHFKVANSLVIRPIALDGGDVDSYHPALLDLELNLEPRTLLSQGSVGPTILDDSEMWLFNFSCWIYSTLSESCNIIYIFIFSHISAKGHDHLSIEFISLPLSLSCWSCSFLYTILNSLCARQSTSF